MKLGNRNYGITAISLICVTWILGREQKEEVGTKKKKKDK